MACRDFTFILWLQQSQLKMLQVDVTLSLVACMLQGQAQQQQSPAASAQGGTPPQSPAASGSSTSQQQRQRRIGMPAGANSPATPKGRTLLSMMPGSNASYLGPQQLWALHSFYIFLCWCHVTH
jgi:hypothetical protein